MVPKNWILLRGLTRGGFHWLGFDKTLQAGLKCETVLCPDLPGNGLLFREESPVDLGAAVEKIRAQLDLKNKKWALFTVSMGSMIGTQWAEMYPDEISHLVIANSSFSSLNPFYQRLRPSNYLSLLKSVVVMDAERIEKFILRSTSNQPEKWPAALSALVEFQRTHPVSSKNFVRQLVLSKSAKFPTKPAAQILVMVSENDHLVSAACSRAIAQTWNAPLEVNTDAGHDITFDDPDWVIEKIKVHFDQDQEKLF